LAHPASSNQQAQRLAGGKALGALGELEANPQSAVKLL
jgi:hypothetical protein